MIAHLTGLSLTQQPNPKAFGESYRGKDTPFELPIMAPMKTKNLHPESAISLFDDRQIRE